MSLRSRKAVPAIVSSSSSRRMRSFTLENSVLSEESAASHEVDTTAYNIPGSEFGTVILPYTLTECITIVPVPAPAITFPSG